MKIKTKISYPAWKKGPRSKEPHLKQVDEFIQVELKEAMLSELEPAFSVNGDTIYAYHNRLFFEVDPRQIDCNAKRWESKLDVLCRVFEQSPLFTDYSFARDYEARRAMVFKASAEISKYLLVDKSNGTRPYPMKDDMLMIEVVEPRYCVMAFDDEPHKGCVAIMASVESNRDLPLDHYFSALDKDYAIAFAKRLAVQKGYPVDLNIYNTDIKVFLKDEVAWPRRLQDGSLAEYVTA